MEWGYRKFTEAFMWQFDRFGERIAMVDDENGTLIYSELEQFCYDLKTHINERKLVFVLCSNSIGSVAGYVSFIQNGIVPLLLDGQIDKSFLDDLIQKYKPDFLWTALNADLKRLKDRVVYEKYGYSLIKTDYSEECHINDELALLLTTSGSTGSPKLVRQSYKNIKSNAEAIAEYLEITNEERPITTLPMNYTYGLSIINSHLIKGATVLLTNKGLMQKEFWDFFKQQKATSFGGVPYTYEMLKRLRFFKMDLPSLKTMTQAGGKLSPELHQEFAEYAQEYNKRFFVMYGQTEATARMAYLPYQNALKKCGSMGIAIPGGEFSLIDVDGQEIKEAGIVGELVYKGPNVSLGYAQSRDDLQKGDENNGTLVTGDMAKCDKDGYHYIVGRKKRFIKIYGNRVNLDETERMVKTAYEHLDCACCGEDDKMKIYITDETQKDNVKKFVADKTGIHFSAYDVIFIQKIPKNESGKTIYAKLD